MYWRTWVSRKKKKTLIDSSDETLNPKNYNHFVDAIRYVFDRHRSTFERLAESEKKEKRKKRVKNTKLGKILYK